MTIVTAAEAEKNFGHYRDQALAEPVVLRQKGKPSVVMLSEAEYQRLKKLDRRVRLLDEMSDAELDEMASSEIPEEHRYSVSNVQD